MTNKFIPMKRVQSLYCVWIKTGNPRRPLQCLWIDLEMRSFQAASFRNQESIYEASSGDEGERTNCARKKASSAQDVETTRPRR